MRARIGADDLELFEDPRPHLLEQISGIRPEAKGLHVLLDEYGVQSTQRLALSGFGGGLVVALWPGELKTQAEYLYGGRRATPMISRALREGWSAAGSPHLAFRNSAPQQRLYMKPTVDAMEYAARWEATDLRHVGQHAKSDVRRFLWPWLKQRGYADDDDDVVLEQFLDGVLGKRPAFLRPGLRLHGRWDAEAVGSDEIVSVVRRSVNAILAAADEPPLPTSRVN